MERTLWRAYTNVLYVLERCEVVHYQSDEPSEEFMQALKDLEWMREVIENGTSGG